MECLGVEDDRRRHGYVRVRVHVDVAQALQARGAPHGVVVTRTIDGATDSTASDVPSGYVVLHRSEAPNAWTWSNSSDVMQIIGSTK